MGTGFIVVKNSVKHHLLVNYGRYRCLFTVSDVFVCLVDGSLMMAYND